MINTIVLAHETKEDYFLKLYLAKKIISTFSNIDKSLPFFKINFSNLGIYKL